MKLASYYFLPNHFHFGFYVHFGLSHIDFVSFCSERFINTDVGYIVQVLQYLLDDVSDFLATHFSDREAGRECKNEGKGCGNILKAFIDHISARESENFRSRRHDNKNSVTLTTIHQVKKPHVCSVSYRNGNLFY